VPPKDDAIGTVSESGRENRDAPRAFILISAEQREYFHKLVSFTPRSEWDAELTETLSFAALADCPTDDPDRGGLCPSRRPLLLADLQRGGDGTQLLLQPSSLEAEVGKSSAMQELFPMTGV
jgi:hypothetical protein